MLDELGLPERVNAGLRLLEAAGKPEPWQEEPKKFWEKPQLAMGLAAATLALLIGLGIVWSGSSTKSVADREARRSKSPSSLSSLPPRLAQSACCRVTRAAPTRRPSRSAAANTSSRT